MRIVFLGPPGAGKGTQSVGLARHLGVPHLSSGDLLRAEKAIGGPRAQQIQQHLSGGNLVPDPLVLEIIRERFQHDDCRGGCLLDGFPRNRVQAEALDVMLCETSTPLNLVLELAVDPELLVKRLAGRGRADDEPEVIRNRLEIYRRQTAPLLEYYRKRGILRTINGNGTQEDVAAQIKEAVGNSVLRPK